MATSFAPLRHRSFALLWTASFVSNVGTWMETVALGYYVTHETKQAAWAGAIAAAAFVPSAVLAPLGGVLADRGSRKQLFFITTIVLTGLATLIAILMVIGNPHPGIVALVVLGEGCASALGFPAYQAMIPDLVPTEDLVAAVGLGSAQYNLGRVVGPALTGIVISLAGISWALFFNAASFLAVLGALTVVVLPTRTGGASGSSVLDSLRRGFRFVRREPGLSVSFRTMCVVTVLAAPFIALIPAMAIKELHGGSGTTAILVTAQGIGAVTVALSMSDWVARFGSRRMLIRAMTALVCALLAYAAAPVTALSALALVAVGGAYLGCLMSFTTIAQQRAPGALRGRVVSLNMVILGTLYPFGAVLQGRIADAVGLRWVTSTAALSLGAVMILTRLLRPGFTAALDEPVDAQIVASVGAAS
jgi:MFS family permease